MFIRNPFASILYALAFLLTTVDTHLFVYPSLSHALMSGIVIALLGIYAFGKMLSSKEHVPITTGHWLVLAWIVYICWGH